jgi:hypothetical protein
MAGVHLIIQIITAGIHGTTIHSTIHGGIRRIITDHGITMVGIRLIIRVTIMEIIGVDITQTIITIEMITDSKATDVRAGQTQPIVVVV